MKYLPLLQLAPRLVETMSAKELKQLVSGFVPKGSVPDFVATLTQTRGMTGEDAMGHILKSPVVQTLVNGTRQQTEEAESSLFCRCPECGFTYETQLNVDVGK